LSILGKLSGKSLKVKIGDVDLELKPLKFKEREVLEKVFSTTEGKVQIDAIMDFIRKVLVNSYPDATKEELDDISFEHFTELSQAVLKVHGMEAKESDLKNLASEVQSQKGK